MTRQLAAGCVFMAPGRFLRMSSYAQMPIYLLGIQFVFAVTLFIAMGKDPKLAYLSTSLYCALGQLPFVIVTMIRVVKARGATVIDGVSGLLFAAIAVWHLSYWVRIWLN